jgi:hypothetical protein
MHPSATPPHGYRLLLWVCSSNTAVTGQWLLGLPKDSRISSAARPAPQCLQPPAWPQPQHQDPGTLYLLKLQTRHTQKGREEGGGSSDLGSAPKEERRPLLACCDWLPRQETCSSLLEPGKSRDIVHPGPCPAEGQRSQGSSKWKYMQQEELELELRNCV